MAAITKLTYTMTEHLRLKQTSAGYVTCPLTRSSGEAILSHATVSKATISVSGAYQYSDWREFKIYKNSSAGTVMSDALRTEGDAYDNGSSPTATPNTWSLYTTTALYTDLSAVVFKHSESGNADEVIMGFPVGCVVTVEITHTALPILDGRYPEDAQVPSIEPQVLQAVIATPGAPASYAYQWYKNGVAIPGATSAALAVAPEVDAAKYYCTVTNDAGTVQTREATLKLSSGASIVIADQLRAAIPYIYTAGKWTPVVPYIYSGGAFRVASATTGTITPVEPEEPSVPGTPDTPDIPDTSDVPEYWQSYLGGRASAIDTALNSAGSNRSAFLWYTDAHWTTNYGTSPVLLEYLSENTGMQKTFFGGDVAVEKTGEIETIQAWQAMVADIPNHHSVMGNHDFQTEDIPGLPTTYAGKAAFFLDPEYSSDVVYGTDAERGKAYYYIDNQAEKTRYICLSTAKYETRSDEIKWCINALNTTPEGWHIVAISHMWLNSDYSGGTATLITTPPVYVQCYLDMFDAYNSRLSGADSYKNNAYDFTAAQAKIEFVIGGHVHQDYDFATANGIPVILTECDAWQERDDDSTATEGTTTESCVYGVVADYSSKVVKVINVGRGSTRTITIPDLDDSGSDDNEDVVSYTNWLTHVVAADGSISEGTNYITDTRISVSSGDFEERSETGWCTTGLIPAVAGDIIRLKNCKFPKTNPYEGTSHRGGIYGANADGTYSGQMVYITELCADGSSAAPVYDTDGDNIIQFKVPSSIKSPGYVRLVVQEFTKDSIITVNEEIDKDAPDDTPEQPSVNYTNWLNRVVGTDGSISEGTNYVTDTRISVSSGSFEERSETGWCTTGLIPAVAGDVIRLKNCKFPKTHPYPDDPERTTHRCSIHGANADGTWSGQSVYMNDIVSEEGTANPVFDTDGDNIIQFNVPKSIQSPGYIRLVVQEFTTSSIVTVNEEISADNSKLETTEEAQVHAIYPVEGTLIQPTIEWAPTQEGSGEPSASNIRAFVGASSIMVTQCGANLMQVGDNQGGEYNGIAWSAADGAVSAVGTSSALSYSNMSNLYWIPVLPNGKYMTSGYTDSISVIAYLKEDGSNAYYSNGKSFEIADNKVLVRVYCQIGKNKTVEDTIYPMVVAEGVTVDTPEPYKGVSYLTSLGSTVYGGRLDMATGILTVTHGSIDAYAGEDLGSSVWLSDRDVYAAGTTPSTGAHVVYALTEPYTVQCPAQSIPAFAGVNTLLVDYGVMEISYRKTT